MGCTLKAPNSTGYYVEMWFLLYP